MLPLPSLSFLGAGVSYPVSVIPVLMSVLSCIQGELMSGQRESHRKPWVTLKTTEKNVLKRIPAERRI